MHVALTGGTGFIGRHLTRRLREEGCRVTLLSRGLRAVPQDLTQDEGVDFVSSSVTDEHRLREAFEGCEAVAHLAGINFERGEQTYQSVHVEGTAAVISTADAAGVDRILLTSYLRARPGTGSGYFSSKWTAETLLRDASVDGIVLKPAAVFGDGDQLLTHLARVLQTVPLVPSVGLKRRELRPVAVEDVADIATEGLTTTRFVGDTLPIMGPESLSMVALTNRIAAVLDNRALTVPTPTPALSAGAWVQEQLFDTPLVTRAAVRMLREGMETPAPLAVCDRLPEDVRPDRAPSPEYLIEHLPPVRPLGRADLRW